uniref:homologous recombination OB-fold protein-like n=1 Tax=Myxine glutinosa TaxID=7769 RepID=UPI00358FD499
MAGDNALSIIADDDFDDEEFMSAVLDAESEVRERSLVFTPSAPARTLDGNALPSPALEHQATSTPIQPVFTPPVTERATTAVNFSVQLGMDDDDFPELDDDFHFSLDADLDFDMSRKRKTLRTTEGKGSGLLRPNSLLSPLGSSSVSLQKIARTESKNETRNVSVAMPSCQAIRKPAASCPSALQKLLGLANGTSTGLPSQPSSELQRRPQFSISAQSTPGLGSRAPICHPPSVAQLKSTPPLPRNGLHPPSGSHLVRSLFSGFSPQPSLALPQQNRSHSTTPRPKVPPDPSIPLQGRVITNRLAQLVSASNRLTPLPQCTDAGRSCTKRRFPGPAGLLPQHCAVGGLETVMVSIQHVPAHGAIARRANEESVSASQLSAFEDDFSRGAWSDMRRDLGEDERNPTSFLWTNCIVMVLRKASLKKLPKGKVSDMCVLLKSFTPTGTDARALFKDPTGEMMGTLHRQLVEQQHAELKPGAVFYLKQVGVLSPTCRNHYLNVTLRNVIYIFSPDGSRHAISRLQSSSTGHATSTSEADDMAPSTLSHKGGGDKVAQTSPFENWDDEELDGLLDEWPEVMS